MPSPRGSSAVHDALASQNARYAASPARDAHLRALRGGAAAVVTGQQAGLFLGPLYTLYKAATAVRLAGALAQDRQEPVVPVFWLQTEDHDLEEIASCHVAPPRGPPLRLALPAGDSGVSIAYLRLPPEVDGVLAALRAALAGTPHGAAHADRLARHYRPGAGWSDAFAGVLAELFSDEGLVLLDPRDPAIARAAAPVHRRALEEQEAVCAALVARAEALAAEGRPVPVHVRRDAPLSFFHPDGPAGPRYRLARTKEGRFAEVGGQGVHALPELLARLEEEPLAFSTSALLRPVVQDTVLPTIAYVGGPSEVAYAAQLPPLHAHFGLPAPEVRLRARFRLLDAQTRALGERLGLSPDDAAAGEEALIARCGRAAGGLPAPQAVTSTLTAAFERALGELEPSLRKAGGRVDTALRKTRSSVARSVARLGRNYDRARLRTGVDRVEEIRDFVWRLQPAGAPQERYYAAAGFAAQVGDRGLVERILAAVDARDPAPAQRDILL